MHGNRRSYFSPFSLSLRHSSKDEPDGNDGAQRTSARLDDRLDGARGRITMRNAIGFGIGDFFGGGQLTLVGTYLVLFWTRFCHMGIATAQGIVGLSALISAVAALLFGILDDNLYRFRLGRRFGRRRFILMIIAPLILVGVLLWIPGLPLAVYFVVYVFWVSLSQLFAAAYSPLAGEMTRDFEDRTLLSTVRMAISSFSGTLILLAGSAILSLTGEHTPGGYMLLTCGSVVLFAVAVFICWRSTWEMTPDEAGFARFSHAGDASANAHVSVGVGGWARRGVRILTEYASTLHLSVFRKHMAIHLIIQVSGDVFGQLFVFFVIYDWNQSAAFASLLLSSGIISLPLMPLFAMLISKIGPRRLYAIAFAGTLVSLTWMFAAWLAVDRLPRGLWMAVAVSGALVFFAFKSMCGYIPWTVFPFVADVDQVVSGRYRASTFSGMQAGVRQAVSGLATIGVGLALSAIGFDSRRSWQPQGTRIGLAVLMFGIYAVFMVVCWLVSNRFLLDRRTDAMVLAEIERVRQGGRRRDVDPVTRQVIESLSGQRYGR